MLPDTPPSALRDNAARAQRFCWILPPPPLQPPVRSLVGCVLRQASTQAQQNKILISGTRGAPPPPPPWGGDRHLA